MTEKIIKDKLFAIVQKEIDACDKISDFDKRLRCKSKLLYEITEIQDVTNINIIKDMDKSMSDVSEDPRWIPVHMVDNANAIILGISRNRYRPDLFWEAETYVKEKMDSLNDKRLTLRTDIPKSIPIKKREK